MNNPLRVTKKVSLYRESTPTDGPSQLEELPLPEPPEPPYRTGGAAYPTYPTDDGKFGISLLDFFAASALTGLAMRADLSLDDLKTDGAKHAYWIAAQMVDLRNELPIETTPVPTGEVESLSQTIAPPVPAGAHGVVTTTAAPDTPGVALAMPDHGRVAAP